MRRKRKKTDRKYSKILRVDEGIGFMWNFFLFPMFQVVWKMITCFKESRSVG